MKSATCLLLVALVTSSCSLVGGEERPAAEDSAARDAAARGDEDGALGRGERTLLQDYQALVEERDDLQAELESSRDELGRLRQRAEDATSDRDREHTARRAAETEVERLGGRVRELEAKLLATGIEHARTEQELLQLRIEVLEQELAEPEGPPDGSDPDGLGALLPPAAPPEGGDR